MSNNKQSSIDWLISQYKKQGFFYDLDIEAAKAMHKQEIKDAVNSLKQLSWVDKGEDYYKQTFEQ